MAILIDQLERLLRHWEDHRYLLAYADRMLSRGLFRAGTGLEGLIQGVRTELPIFANLRGDLLAIHEQGGLDRIRKYHSPLKRPENWASRWRRVPLMLGHWCKRSRRVYHIGSDLIHLLRRTSFEGIKFTDVSLPFESFAISLESPIPCESGSTNLLVVTESLIPEDYAHFTDEEAAYYTHEIYPIPLATMEIEPLSRMTKSRLADKERHRLYPALQNLIGKELTRQDTIPNDIREIQIPMDKPDSADRFFSETAELAADAGRSDAEVLASSASIKDEISRLVIGFCLYLESLPPGSTHVSQWRPAVRSGAPDPRAVTKGSEICTVASIYDLTREEREILGGSERRRYEVCCHFRAGHKRRPPGQGHDPNAERTVKVRPTIVRRDRMPPEGLPGGVQQNVDI